MVIAGLAAWAGSDPTAIPAYMGKNIYQGNLTMVDKQIVRVLSALGTVIALAYCQFTKRAFTPADPDRSFIQNMLIMMGRVEEHTGQPDPTHVDCLERLWVLYADHELTSSTAAYLHVASTLADPSHHPLLQLLPHMDHYTEVRLKRLSKLFRNWANPRMYRS